MGRFEKLNRDIRGLAEKMLEDQDLCKLIHYPDANPFSQPDINGKKELLDKRLLLFAPKFPIAKEVGSYVSIRAPRFYPSRGGYYVVSLLCFDIFIHEKSREIFYLDKNGNVEKGNRALIIMDKIEDIMSKSKIGIGENNLEPIVEITNNNATFSGYSLGYKDVDFRNLSR